MKKRRVIPTVFARNKKEFSKRFNKLLKISNELQIDFMDGKFVKSTGIKISDLPNLRKFKGKKFEAHLMVNNPEKWIKKLKAKGFRKIIFHIDVIKNMMKILKISDSIKKEKMEAWIALNPETSEKKIFNILTEVDGILFMGVYPGREHQKFINSVYGKISRLRKKNKRIKIQVDGGVNLDTIKKLRALQVNYVNSGSFVADANEPRKALGELEKVFSTKPN